VGQHAVTTRHRAAVSAALVLAILYSWVAGHFTTFTCSAEVATFIPGLVGLLIVIRVGPRGRVQPDRSRLAWLAWWFIVIGLNAIELISLALGSTDAHPTISDLVNPWLLSTPSRAVGFALWLTVGYWLSRR
jgi:hypothetical protein